MTQQPPQPGTSATPVRFKVRQRLTLMVNRYEIHGVDDAGVETQLWASPSRSAWRSRSK